MAGKSKIKYTGSTEKTIEDAVESFLRRKKSDGVSVATLKSYQRNFKNFTDFCKKSCAVYLNSVNDELITEYKNYLLEYQKEDDSELTVSSRNTYLTLVRIWCNFYFKSGDLKPFEIKLFSAKSNKNISQYSDDEVELLVTSAAAKSIDFPQRRNYVMVLFLLMTGVRRSTLINIKVDDVDLQGGTVLLRHLKRDNPNSIPQIPINSDLNEVLSKYINSFGLVGEDNPGGYLFPTSTGKKFDPDNASKAIKEFCEKSGVHFRGCHEFRRTFASLLFSRSNSSDMTQRLMCLSDPRMLGRYINVHMDQMREEANMLNLVTMFGTKKAKIAYKKRGSK